MPTVNRPAVHQPPSAAPSRSGRHTPSISSRPSLAGGTSTSHDIFSASGRITPSHTFTSITTTTTPTRNQPRYGTNSRISRNAPATGKQSQSYKPSSPTTPGRDIHSNSETFAHENKTYPTLSNGVGDGPSTIHSRYVRTPHAVRPRVPSAVAMPPPPSPISNPLRRPPIVNGESPSEDEGQCMSGAGRYPSLSMTSPLPSLPTPADNLKSGPEIAAVNPQSVGAISIPLHKEDEDLQRCASMQVGESDESYHHVEVLRDSNQNLLNEISQLQTKLRQSEAALTERSSAADAIQQAFQELNKQRVDNEQRLKELERQLSEAVASRNLLKQTLQLKEAQESEHELIVTGKSARIGVLEAHVKQLATQSEAEKKELSSQVEELRRAGQVRVSSAGYYYYLVVSCH